MESQKKISNIDDLTRFTEQVRKFFFYNCSRTLICVDDFMAQKALTNVIQSGGGKDIVTVKEKSEVETCLQDYPGPILVFYHIQFSKVNILDFLKKLKGCPHEGNTRVVLVSPIALSEAHVKQFRSFGVKAFLKMPLETDQLTQCLNTLLQTF
jgi:response regulator RpfG family c-di-GMP phosphodiesterase